MLYGFLCLALCLVLCGDRAGEYDQGSKHHNHFLHGHRIFSFQTQGSALETLSGNSLFDPKNGCYCPLNPCSRQCETILVTSSCLYKYGEGAGFPLQIESLEDGVDDAVHTF
jgi:hypothetical protein